ncbi:UNVERIFIED_CONTAM: hypothetical protein K2H54_038127 [Gekko kuhli]
MDEGRERTAPSGRPLTEEDDGRREGEIVDLTTTTDQNDRKASSSWQGDPESLGLPQTVETRQARSIPSTQLTQTDTRSGGEILTSLDASVSSNIPGTSTLDREHHLRQPIRQQFSADGKEDGKDDRTVPPSTPLPQRTQSRKETQKKPPSASTCTVVQQSEHGLNTQTVTSGKVCGEKIPHDPVNPLMSQELLIPRLDLLWVWSQKPRHHLSYPFRILRCKASHSRPTTDDQGILDSSDSISDQRLRDGLPRAGATSLQETPRLISGNNADGDIENQGWEYAGKKKKKKIQKDQRGTMVRGIYHRTQDDVSNSSNRFASLLQDEHLQSGQMEEEEMEMEERERLASASLSTQQRNGQRGKQQKQQDKHSGPSPTKSSN